MCGSRVPGVSLATLVTTVTTVTTAQKLARTLCTCVGCHTRLRRKEPFVAKKRNTGPTLTGADALFVLAHQAAERGQPWAVEFARMIDQAFGDHDQLLTEAIAKRPLAEHEASPAAIFMGAVEVALQRGDAEMLSEVVQVGTPLLSKWAHYLVVADAHPTLKLKY